MANRAAQANGLVRRARLRQTETIELSLQAFRGLGWALLRQSALPALYCIVVVDFANRFFLENLLMTREGAKTGEQLTEIGIRLGGLVLLGGPLLVLGIAYLSALAATMVGDWVSGLVPDERGAVRRALEALPRVAGAVFLEALMAASVLLLSLGALFVSSLIPDSSLGNAAVIATFGFVGLSISWVWIAYRWVVSGLLVPVVLNEGLRGLRASKRSRELLSRATTGRSGQFEIIKLFLTLFVLEIACSGGFEGAVQVTGLSDWIRRLVGDPWLQNVLSMSLTFLVTFLVYWIALSFGAVGRAVLYFERRMKLEGLDVELLARAAWRKERRARFEI
jgi:hypothetical protein